jgi:muramoyltetrapeptide carboxypeptidase LdcA involved in peptidoglycan recycling
MNYPKNLKIGDTIGICAPSAGIVEEDKIIKLEQAILNLEKMGYKVIETESVRKCDKGRSNTAKKRAEEFMELWKNAEVKLILYAGGGDFLMEMLDELDFEEIKKYPSKWTQGFSDITTISYLLNTICEIPSMYCDAVKSYAMNPLYRNLEDSLKLVSGQDVVQNSFTKHTNINEEENLDYTYNLTLETKWKNITGQNEICIEGRVVGGCLDCIDALIGTKYDNISSYIEQYKDDGILWFLECFEMNTPQLQRILWKMKNAGYFKYCKGVIFGRSLMMREDYEISFDESVLAQIGNLGFPIITEADIGHIPPQLAIMQGAVLKITSKNGKGTVETFRR